jgi:hypothetical protein
MAMLRAALCVVASAGALVGCTSDDSDSGLREGTFAVSSMDLGSCSDDLWTTSRTTTTSIVIETNGEQFMVKACTEGQSCVPSSPSDFVWTVDQWKGEIGGAYLIEGGCLLNYVNATAQISDGELVIESTRWSSQLASGSCTYAEVLAMSEGPCSGRTRLIATEQ